MFGMNIKINSGGIGKISVLAFNDSVVCGIEYTAGVIDSFVDVENDTYNLNGGVGDCQEALDSLDTRIQLEIERLDLELEFQHKVGDFISLAIRVDDEVANDIRQANNEFYQLNPWARPTLPFDIAGLLLNLFLPGTGFLLDAASFIVKLATGEISLDKDFFAELLRTLGDIVVVAGIVLGVVLAVISAPAVLIIGSAALIGFTASFLYGISYEVEKHGSDFDAYNMSGVLKNALLDAATEMVFTFIGCGIGKLIGLGGKFIGGKIAGIIGGTKFGNVMISITKINYNAPLLERAGKAALKEVSKSVASGIASRFTVGFVTDIYHGDGLDNMETTWENMFNPQEIGMDILKGVVEAGAGQLYKNSLIERARKADVSTPKDKSLFYSGTIVVDGENIKANTQAQKISENGAFVPIDKTPGGEEFNKLNLYKKFDDDKAFADYIWGDILSNKYSSQASGTINILAEHVSVSSVFNTIETPNILSGIDTGRVTEINILPNDIFKLITPTN